MYLVRCQSVLVKTPPLSGERPSSSEMARLQIFCWTSENGGAVYCAGLCEKLSELITLSRLHKVSALKQLVSGGILGA